MIKTPQAKQYGKRLQEIALKYTAKNAKLFKASEESFNRDIGMIFSDGADLYSMGGNMIAGDFDTAADIASGLDTVVREAVPNYIWEYLNKYTD